MLGAGTIVDKFSWSESDVRLEPRQGFTQVRVDGCEYLEPAGCPGLPCRVVRYLVPADAEVTGVQTTALDTVEIPGELVPWPAQPSRPIGFPEPEFVPPDVAAYGSEVPYPAEVGRCVHAGDMAGYRIATVLVYPVQWLPAERRLRLFTRMSVRISYEHGQTQARGRSEGQVGLFAPIVERLVANSEKVRAWRPEVGCRTMALLPEDSFDFVVITDSLRFGPALDSLVFWKNKKGIRTRIADLSLANAYPGRDQAEKLRGFVADAAASWGASYFLLAGDHDVVPVRNCYLFKTLPDTHPNKWFDTIPADLYYSDLDGTWDRNGNNVFGEMVDSVDGYPDVFVGRLCLSSERNCSTAARKVLGYERAAGGGQPGNLRKLLLLNELGTSATDSVARMAPTVMLKQKLSRPDIPAREVIDSLNAGAHLVFQLAHGGPCNLGQLHTSHVGLLGNREILPVYVAQSCLSGRFDCERFRPDWADCLAESMVNCAEAGPVACLMNTSYGWIFDDRHFVEFFASVFRHDIGIGGSLAEAKTRTRSPWPSGYANLYSFTLLGDPTLAAWTDIPRPLTVLCPETVRPGCGLRVVVRNGTQPARNALVALYRPGEPCIRGRTDSLGAVTLNLPPGFPAGPAHLTVTTRNAMPYETVCVVSRCPAARPEYQTHVIDDSTGNRNGELDPGETVAIAVTVANTGENPATDVRAELCCGDTWLRVTGGSRELGTIAPGGIATAVFAVSLDSRSPTNRYLAFELPFRFNTTERCTSHFSVPVPPMGTVDVHPDFVYEPVPYRRYYQGQPLYPRCRISNSGTRDALGVLVRFAWGDSSIGFGPVPKLGPGQRVDVAFPGIGPRSGRYRYQCYTLAAGDIEPANDTICGEFEVKGLPHLPGWHELRPMLGPVGKGGWLVSGGGYPYAYGGRKTLNFYRYFPGQDSWGYRGELPHREQGKRMPPGAGCVAACDGQSRIYVVKGNSSMQFWHYDIAGRMWNQLADVPAGPDRRKVKPGANLVYVVRNDSGYLYLVKGGRTEFYRYDIAADAWQRFGDAPPGPKGKWKAGSFLAHDGGNTIYAHMADYHEFWKYDVERDSWLVSETLPGMPLAGRHNGKVKDKKSKAGACGVWHDGRLYALKGGGTQQLFSFAPGTNTWAELDTIPALGSTGKKKLVKTGADIVSLGFGAVGAFKGNKTNEFWCFVLPDTGIGVAEETDSPHPCPLTAEARPSHLFGQTVGFFLNLPEAGPVRLSVVDALGRVIAEPIRGQLPAGRHRVRFEVPGLPAGAYVLRLEAGAGTVSRRLVVTR